MSRWAPPLILVLGLAACSSDAPAKPGPPDAPPFDGAWRVSTHNSYWVDRGVPGDLFASGTGERILDQLLVDHARGVEIDVHPDPATPGAFLVHHTTPGNTFCDTLPACLAVLRAFHRALPMHEAVHVTMELKGITAPTFDASHTIEDLDRILSDELGASLYRPAELLGRCPLPGATLTACAKAAGWPTTHELRGRFVVSILGNWDGLPGAQATKDYLDYALHGSLADRAAFPMSSAWQLDHEALNGLIYDLVTQDELDRAAAQSVFMQIEDLTDPHAAPLLARHGVVRADGAVTASDQEARAAAGIQLLQTDSPWTQADDHGPLEPLRALVKGFGEAAMKEPGARLSLGPGAGGDRLFAYRLEAAGAETAWETTVSSGADATRVGCLRAATALGSDEGSVTVCRTKIPAGAPDAGAADAERAVVEVVTCQGGACQSSAHPSRDPAAEGPGELLRVEITGSCVRVRSAAAVDRDLTPRWEDLGAPACFAAPPVYQGIATPGAGGAGWFFGTRREAAGAGAGVRGADFTGVVAEGAGDGGTTHDATPLLVDDGAP